MPANSADVFGIALGSVAISTTALTTNAEVANATVTGNVIGSVVKTDTFSAARYSYFHADSTERPGLPITRSAASMPTAHRATSRQASTLAARPMPRRNCTITPFR